MTQDTHTVLTELIERMRGAITHRPSEYGEGFDAAIDICISLVEEKSHEGVEELKKHFEANMLDGNPVDDCGKAILSAEAVWEYIKDNFTNLNTKKHE